jgi:hypothetical protein
MRLALALGAVTALAACESGGLADRLARESARQSVQGALASRFPGVPLEAATDCVIDNATAREIMQLAGAAAQASASQRVTPETTRLVMDIVTRPATIRCLATDGLVPFLL